MKNIANIIIIAFHVKSNNNNYCNIFILLTYIKHIVRYYTNK